jgi:hypothetical protein
MTRIYFDHCQKNTQDEKSIEKVHSEEALHPDRVMEMAMRLNMPLSVAAKLADIPDLPLM